MHILFFISLTGWVVIARCDVYVVLKMILKRDDMNIAQIA